MKTCRKCNKLAASLDGRGYCSKCASESLGQSAVDKIINAVIPKKIQSIIQMAVWLVAAVFVVLMLFS